MMDQPKVSRVISTNETEAGKITARGMTVTQTAGLCTADCYPTHRLVAIAQRIHDTQLHNASAYK